MSLDCEEISNLAHVLHENGDKILNGCSKLSVNAALLQKIGVELGNISAEGRVDGSAKFEVLSPQHSRSRSVDHLLFLHDFFQKTLGLKLVNSANLLPTNAKIDLSKFKKLKYLELKRVPVKQLIGLKVVQHQVECIVCERGLTALEHLLAECGGDNSTGFVWSELKEAVLSFNEIKIVDSSVAFAPWLQVLDLSHNQIFDVNAIERLPNLKYVNLSYNSLSAIPIFNKSAKKRMEVLVLKNNYIEDLNPLSGLDALTELDLSNNMIWCSRAFQPFLSMSTLQWLSMEGNPVCVVSSYRVNVVKNLHISASFGNFVLDGVSLSKKEREQVGVELMTQIPFSSSSSPLLGGLTDSAPVTSDPPAAEVTEKHRKKSGKVRLAVIPNIDGTYEDLPPEATDISLSAPPISDHLITKGLIASARGTYGDNWLRCEAAEVVKDILGLPKTSLSSTPYDDSCLAAILNQVETPSNGCTMVTTEAVIELPPSDEFRPLDTNESFMSCAYFSMDSSRDTAVDDKEMSPDIETIVDSEEDRDEVQERLYLVVRIIRDGSEVSREELFLSLSSTEMREREATHGRTVGSWSLASLESVTRTRDREVHLVFDTIRRDRRERHYELEVSEAGDLYIQCRAELEARSLSDMRQTPYRCVQCSLAFVVENKPKSKADGGPTCPVCGSKVVLQSDEVPSPAVRPGKKELPPTHTPSHRGGHNRSASVGVASGGAQEIPKCSSHSSIGSAASLDDERLAPLPVVLAAATRRCDSDIEIISNPSQSSIEVIDAPPRLAADVTSQEEETGNEKMTSPTLTAVAAFAGLTESSSSGSVTDSICTAYENSSMVSSGVSKKSSGLESSTISSTVIEEPSDSDEYNKQTLVTNHFQHLLLDVLEKVGEKVSKQARSGVDKDIDIVEYSFSDFGVLDHRIKLYVYAHLFEDNAEECLFLLRCQVLTVADENCYDACVVCSSMRLYVLKVTGKEEGEEASKFLHKVDGLSIGLGSVKSWGTLGWNQGFRVSFRAGYDRTQEFLILLKDSKPTLNFLTFVSPYEGLFPKCEWIRKPDPGPNLRLTQFLVSAADDSTLLALSCFTEFRMGEEEPVRGVPDGAILVTSTDLFIVSSLKWMLSSAKETSFPAPVSSQKLSDLMQAGVGERELRLQFLREAEGRQEVWSLTFTAHSVVTSLLNALKTPWEDLFSVPLQVTTDESF